MGQGCGAGEGFQAVGEVIAQDGARDGEALQGRQRQDRLELREQLDVAVVTRPMDRYSGTVSTCYQNKSMKRSQLWRFCRPAPHWASKNSAR
jgi:hypothetical protein